MIDTVLNGEDVRRLFPAETLSDTTGVFLEQVIAAEIDIAQTILGQLTFVKEDRPAFLALLGRELTEEEQNICQEVFAQLPHNNGSELLMRYLNGESYPLIGADIGTHKIAVWRVVDPFRRELYARDERMRDILNRLKPHFPQHSYSIAEGLTECLPYIDGELATLAVRREQKLDEEAFSYLACSLVHSSMTAQEALLILARLNAPRLPMLSNGNPAQRMRGGYRQKATLKYDAYSDFFQKFRKNTPNIYEHSDEATDLLLQAIAAHNANQTPIPSKASIIEYAKGIEAGVLADDLLEQNEQDWPVDATREELHQLVKLGEIAVYQLLKSHTKFAHNRARRILYRMESPREVQDVILVAMRGLLRAIRRYDYTTGYKLSPLAEDSIDEFLRRDIMKHDWKMAWRTGRQLFSLRAHRSILGNELQEEPSAQAIAERMGISRARVDELLLEEDHMRQRLRGGGDAALDHASTPAESTSGFGPNTKQLLQQTLKSQPLGYEILELHFAQHYPIAEVAKILKKPPQDIQQRLEAALAALQSSIEPATLRQLFKHD